MLLHWDKDPNDPESFGHTSLLLINGAFVSGWPLFPENASTKARVFKSTERSKNRTLLNDITGEGRYPDSITLLPPDLNLNHTAMVDEWLRIQTDTRYKLARNNCAQTVWRVLEAGNPRLINMVGDVKRLQWLYYGPGSLSQLIENVILSQSNQPLPSLHPLRPVVGRLLAMCSTILKDFITYVLIITLIQTLVQCYKSLRTRGEESSVFVDLLERSLNPLWLYHLVKAVGFFLYGEASGLTYILVTGVVYWVFK